jgi:hypothetical protein
MKVRKKNLCDTCRKRKLQVCLHGSAFRMYGLILVAVEQCDGKRPACTQCVFSKRMCEGYPNALFVPFDATKTAAKPRARPKPGSQAKKSLPVDAQCLPGAKSGFTLANDDSTTLSQDAIITSNNSPHPTVSYPPDPATIQEKVSLILRHFIPIQELGCDAADGTGQCSWFCGSWAKALPELTADISCPFSQCLYSAVSALALSITANRDHEDRLDAIVVQYEDSLRLLGNNLAVAGDTYQSKLVAAVMCLALTEVNSSVS